jgi:hypothetical protein
MRQLETEPQHVDMSLTDSLRDPWEGYDAWNAAVAEEFFAGRWGGRPVYLDLEDDVYGRLRASALAAYPPAPEELIAAVRPTLRFAEHGSLFARHLRRLARWRRDSTQVPPPVLAVLALLSLVAEQMHSDIDFSSSNYYGRFVQMLGEDINDDSLRQKVVRGFAEGSHAMWRELNDWVSDEPDVRGIPTAYAFDFRVHVGVPMSQALVREPDRRRLQDLFAEARLRPGERLSHSDMLRLLRQWIPNSTLSRSLKLLCAQPEVLERVAEVACVELEAWEGQVEAAETNARSELALVAYLRSKPRRRLDLSIAARLPTGSREDALLLDADSGPAARIALEDAGGRLELDGPDEAGWRAVRNASAVSIPDLLLATLQLTTAGGHRVRRVPRRLIVLEREESMLRYAEVPRARLGCQYVLLAMEALQADLAVALKEAARPGYRAIRPKFLPGLPAGWVAYMNVELIGITSSNQADLAALIPVAWSQVSFSGGLKLPGRGSWHVDAPPELNASSFAGAPVDVVLHHEAVGADEQDKDARDDMLVGVLEGADVFDLSASGLETGRYRAALITADDASETIGSASLRLASASDVGGAPTEGAAIALDDAASGIFGAWGTSGARGAGWDAAPVAVANGCAPVTTSLADLVSGSSDEEQDDVLPPIAPAPQPASVANCLETGAHYFRLDQHPGRRGLADMFGGDCGYCGLEKFFPARPRRGKRWNRRRQAGAGRAAQLQDVARSLADVPRRPDAAPVDLNVLLDALSLIGSGDWPVLQRLVAQHDERPWAATEIATLLASLGHLDVTLDRATVRPARWSIAPSTIVVAEHATFLAGFRSDALVEAVARHTVRRGLQLLHEPAEDAPDRISLPNVGATEIQALAAAVRDAEGVQLDVTHGPGERIAGWLPALEELRQALPLDDVTGHDGLERFDPATARWTPVDAARTDGAYRTTRVPRRHWHRVDGESRRCLDPLSKWLAAADREPLLAYDPGSQQLACHVGVALPGLFERAVVLASGRRPSRTGRHLVYEVVDEHLAATLVSKLRVPVR